MLDLPNRPASRSLELVNTKLNDYALNFLKPDIASIAHSLSQPIRGVWRFFLEVDYVVPNAALDRVDDWQDKLRRLWEQNPVPPVRLTYNSAKLGAAINCIVYPVCIYYAQRAVYLCAFGQTPTRQGNWYNYRLDRIQQITQLQWTNPDIPQFLLHSFQQGTLPSPDYIKVQLAEAWGFDFYQSPKPMLLRFDREFHDRYIQGTFRHETFKSVSYQEAELLIKKHTRQQQPQQALLKVLESRSPQDAYYHAHYREDDPNVKQRLRAWRPKCEILLPWKLRQSIAEEVEIEFQLYRN